MLELELDTKKMNQQSKYARLKEDIGMITYITLPQHFILDHFIPIDLLKEHANRFFSWCDNRKDIFRDRETGKLRHRKTFSCEKPASQMTQNVTRERMI